MRVNAVLGVFLQLLWSGTIIFKFALLLSVIDKLLRHESIFPEAAYIFPVETRCTPSGFPLYFNLPLLHSPDVFAFLECEPGQATV